MLLVAYCVLFLTHIQSIYCNSSFGTTNVCCECVLTAKCICILWVHNTECTIKSLIKSHCCTYKQNLFSHASYSQLCHLEQSFLTHIFTTHKEKKYTVLQRSCGLQFSWSISWIYEIHFSPFFVISHNQCFL